MFDQVTTKMYGIFFEKQHWTSYRRFWIV